MEKLLVNVVKFECSLHLMFKKIDSVCYFLTQFKYIRLLNVK